MIKELISFLSLPDTPAITAILETLVLIAAILLTGFIVNMADIISVKMLSLIVGAGPAFLIRNYITWPGTVLHELSHALFAFILGAKIREINLFPKGETLGSVSIVPRGNLILRSLQLSFSAIAPIVTGFIGIILMWNYLQPGLNKVWHYILFWYFMISIFFHMSLSPEDRKNFFSGIIPTAVLIFLIFLIPAHFGTGF